MSHSTFYDILIWIYDHHPELRDVEELRVNLLKGLSDESEAIITKIYEFWDHESRLDKRTFPRLTQMFMYVNTTCSVSIRTR